MLTSELAELPLDGSAHGRVKDAAQYCMTSSGTLDDRVENAYAMVLDILGQTFGPRSTELLRRLQLTKEDGVTYHPYYRATLGNVPKPRIKQWLLDLFRLYSWSCFLTGSDPELAFCYEDDAIK